MKQSEICIGDWVMFDLNYIEDDPMYSRENFVPYRIKSGEDIDRAVEKTWCGNDVYQPIPITVDVLEKNGFSLDPDIMKLNMYNWYDSTRRVMVRIAGGKGSRTWYVHVDNCDMDTMATFDIDYVHQLQHILSMCGIKHEFEITKVN